jgi:hypothetical protein
MKEVTEQEYLQALKICKIYEAQIENKKLAPYDGCSKNDIRQNIFKDYQGNMCYAFWVTKDTEIPDRDPDGIIKYSGNIFTVDGCRVPDFTLEHSFNRLINMFKRKKYIK